METLDEEKCCKLVMLLWGLWKRRIGVVWKDEHAGEMSVRSGAEAMLRGWREAQSSDAAIHNASAATSTRCIEKWQRPRVGWKKINVDGAINDAKGIRAWSWIARDAEGEFLVDIANLWRHNGRKQRSQ
ncbi:unnamed protein product [Cuscuta europaea]|uniref:RNase H type-1 domain-containing protein n=1 Tax=Cuscuta europaea TaxID=41803 RepID=A0A9P1E8G8_CUSEU|nr:unnamed protein product [Cuscuta europaea]